MPENDYCKDQIVFRRELIVAYSESENADKHSYNGLFMSFPLRKILPKKFVLHKLAHGILGIRQKIHH